MATNPKTGNTPKDTQIKPISQGKEPEHELSVNPLQTSKLYQNESKALLESKNPQVYSSSGSSEVTKGKNDADFEPKETARGDENQKKEEKSKEKQSDESKFV